MEPKLLTEAEWECLMREVFKAGTFAVIKDELRDRGLIAPEPEPVDPITVTLCNAMNESLDRLGAFGQDEAENLREELRRRGMELAPAKELTREMVRDAVYAGLKNPRFRCDVEAVFAALAERMK